MSEFDRVKKFFDSFGYLPNWLPPEHIEEILDSGRCQGGFREALENELAEAQTVGAIMT